MGDHEKGSQAPRHLVFAALLTGCCFGPAPATAPPAPIAEPPTPAEIAAGVQQAIEREAARARDPSLSPEQHLAAAEGTLTTHDPHAIAVAQARAHLESVPADHESARVRVARRQLERHENRIGDALLSEARAHLRTGATGQARQSLAAIPPAARAARQVAALTRQIEQREAREARALAQRGPLSELEARGAVILYLQATAHDPSSIDLEACGGLWSTDREWTIDCAYRGTNAFGATVLNASRFHIRQYEVTRAERVARLRQ